MSKPAPASAQPALPGRVVHVVEDDEDSRQATTRLLSVAGHAVRGYASAEEFLAQMPVRQAGCVVLDIELPDGSGLELQDRLSLTTEELPVIFVTGHGDIPMSVRAIKKGAVDFLTKPVPGRLLLTAIDQALARNAEQQAARAHTRSVQLLYERLTPREREVFAHLIGGQLNKQVAYDLGISERTIKAHRHSIMEKLEAGSLADLIRVATELAIQPVRGCA
jgi:FixJ family two-component response regulator